MPCIRKQRGHGFGTSVPILGISNAAQVLNDLIKKQPEPHLGPDNWIGYHEFMRNQRRQYRNNQNIQRGGFFGTIGRTIVQNVTRKCHQCAKIYTSTK